MVFDQAYVETNFIFLHSHARNLHNFMHKVDRYSYD